MSDADSGPPSPERVDRLLFGALAGLSVAVLIQMIDKQPEFNKFLTASLLCFAVALPMLVSSFLLEVGRPGQVKSGLRMGFDLTGILLSLAGFALMFFHLQLVAGCVFLASVIGCFIVVVFSLR